jgi:diguanylate cyclase (GGDEF)-like protein
MGAGAARRSAPPRQVCAVSEQVFAPRSLARVLGVQYAVGGALALGWALLPTQAPFAGRPLVLVLASLAIALGAVMGGLSCAPLSARALNRVAHGCILSAQAVIATAFAATQDPGSPFLLFVLWTTPYAGIFSRRTRWTHVTITALLLTAATMTMPGAVLLRAVAHLVIGLATVIVATLLVSRMTERLHVAATHDALTGLPNRRLFHAATKAALARRATHGGSVLVLLIDLDRFKYVNDTFGHAVGDVLLQLLAPRLRGSVRSADVVARLGGDEFAVLCEDPSGTLDPQDVLARVASAWADPVQVGGRRLYASGSVGVAIASDADTPDTLLRDADTAMYEAKTGGGGRSSVFDPGAGIGRGPRLMAIEHGLRDAIARGELALHYQPVVALQDCRPVGAEGLLRWTSGELGDVGPDEFIEVAERSGLIDQLGAWVLDRALSDLAHWRRSGVVDESFRVAVNVSAHQLTEALPAQVEALLARYRVPPGNLGLEITESAVMAGETPGAVLDRLHALGVTLLLDDFGTGYSSLSHLRRYPFDVVKVDRSFVAGLCAHGEDHALVIGVLSLAHALGKTVAAEGIETSRQLHELHLAGCDTAQGFWLSVPVPAERLEAALDAAGDARADGSLPGAAA